MKRLSIFALGAGLAFSVLGAPAVAQDQPPQTRVKVNDLDLTQARGRAEAERRLQSSASSTCRDKVGNGGLSGMVAVGHCKEDLVHNGRANLAGVSAQQIAAKQEAERRAYASRTSVGKARAHGGHRSAAKRRGHHVVHRRTVRHAVRHRTVIHRATKS